jgi:hypothetical protein
MPVRQSGGEGLLEDLETWRLGDVEDVEEVEDVEDVGDLEK